MPAARKIFAEIAVCFLICLVLTAIDVFCQRFPSPIPDIAWFLAVGSLILLPLIVVRKIHPRDESEAGLDLGLSFKQVLIGLGIVALLFIPVAFGHYLFETIFWGAQFQPDLGRLAQLNPSIPYQCLVQILCVALPEEFFYRGYMQTALTQTLKSSPRFSKYATVTAIILTAFCFALSHLPSGNFTRLATFFPGLLFGFIRHKTNSLVPAILCHAGCNMMMVVLNPLYIMGHI